MIKERIDELIDRYDMDTTDTVFLMNVIRLIEKAEDMASWIEAVRLDVIHTETTGDSAK